MGQHGRSESGMKFFRNGGPADLIPALKHEWLVARFGKVERGHKAVMAAAYDDDVGSRTHDGCLVFYGLCPNVVQHSQPLFRLASRGNIKSHREHDMNAIQGSVRKFDQHRLHEIAKTLASER